MMPGAGETVDLNFEFHANLENHLANSIDSLHRQLEDKKKESERKIELLNKEIENLRVEARKPANYDVIIRLLLFLTHNFKLVF